MKNRRIAAVISALALVPAMLAIASAAQAEVPDVHGCAGGDVCLYATEAEFDNNNPLVIDDSDQAGFFLRGTDVYIAVDNTDAWYASEGYFAGLYNKNHVLLFCEYHPYPQDIESPDTTVHGDDQISYTIETGATLASVDGVKIVPNSYCPSSD